MKRQLPLMIVLVLGIAFTVQFFIPSRASEVTYQTALQWWLVMSSFAMVLALGSLVNHHVLKIKRRKEHWAFSWVTLAGLLVMGALGIMGGPSVGLRWANAAYNQLFLFVQAPMDSAMFAILAFYMASASYRAFRARSKEATVLLIAGFVVMLGIIPFGAMLWRRIPDISEWIMMVPNMASKRGILLGIGLGSTATALKIILGIERSWLGGSGK
ncbi:MAG: hypothetical protein MUF78_06540 [Candidatus Edwardsbacteria bacterium]|jgi:hypothetical protein|nr:hypothetical protein [Candidatus Edwardsbacteria bacterium]